MTIGDHHMFHLQGFPVSFSLEVPLVWATHPEVLIIVIMIMIIMILMMMVMMTIFSMGYLPGGDDYLCNGKENVKVFAQSIWKKLAPPFATLRGLGLEPKACSRAILKCGKDKQRFSSVEKKTKSR